LGILYLITNDIRQADKKDRENPVSIFACLLLSACYCLPVIASLLLPGQASAYTDDCA